MSKRERDIVKEAHPGKKKLFRGLRGKSVGGARPLPIRKKKRKKKGRKWQKLTSLKDARPKAGRRGDAVPQLPGRNPRRRKGRRLWDRLGTQKEAEKASHNEGKPQWVKDEENPREGGRKKKDAKSSKKEKGLEKWGKGEEKRGRCNEKRKRKKDGSPIPDDVTT